MSHVKYRPMEKKDHQAVCNRISQSFGLPGYVEDASVRQAFKKQYFYSCLAEATYTCVAEKDNNVIGVIMGHAKTHYHVYRHLVAIVKLFCCFVQDDGDTVWKKAEHGCLSV